LKLFYNFFWVLSSFFYNILYLGFLIYTIGGGSLSIVSIVLAVDSEKVKARVYYYNKGRCGL